MLRYVAIVSHPTQPEQASPERQNPEQHNPEQHNPEQDGAESHRARTDPAGDPGEPAAGGAALLSQRRWKLIRDVLVFQAKMMIEGLRDVALVPLTLLAGAFGLLFGRERPERIFHDVLRLGHRFDTWLNLFAPAGKRAPPEALGSGEEPTIDQYFERIEHKLLEQHGHGGLTRSARETVDDWLDSLQDATRKKS